MTRKLASIQRVHSIQPIEGADSIEKISVLGWNLVAKKAEFKEEDLCVYFEIDSLLPVAPIFDFLAKQGTKKSIVGGQEIEGYRLKTIRLRGQISQGLALPLSALESFHKPNDFLGMPLVMKTDWNEGDDVTEYIGVFKYEPPIPAELAGTVKGQFPSFIPKTDEPRIQTLPQLLERYKDEVFYVAEKLDGMSMTVYLNDGEFGLCSRNLELKETDNSMWKVARGMDIEKNLRKVGRNVALQGEFYGEGVQGNPLKESGCDYCIFNIYDIDNAKYLDYYDFADLAITLGIHWVPVLGVDFKLLSTIDEMVQYATRKSVFNKNIWAEGLVFRPLIEKRDPDLGRLSFKIINPEYLLKHE